MAISSRWHDFNYFEKGVLPVVCAPCRISFVPNKPDNFTWFGITASGGTRMLRLSRAMYNIIKLKITSCMRVPGTGTLTATGARAPVERITPIPLEDSVGHAVTADFAELCRFPASSAAKQRAIYSKNHVLGK